MVLRDLLSGYYNLFFRNYGATEKMVMNTRIRVFHLSKNHRKFVS